MLYTSVIHFPVVPIGPAFILDSKHQRLPDEVFVNSAVVLQTTRQLWWCQSAKQSRQPDAQMDDNCFQITRMASARDNSTMMSTSIAIVQAYWSLAGLSVCTTIMRQVKISPPI